MNSPQNLNQLVLYGIDIKTFMDGNGDGIGDFIGATSQLDYLHDLGVNCVWLLPFYETPDEDNGYDVMDYHRVNSRLGNLEDFYDFVNEAHQRDIKVIIDFVFHHTSDQHPWFQVSRVDPNSKYHNYYVWTKTRPDNDPNEISNQPAMPGEQSGVWKYDHLAKAYYYHRFYDCEPDLDLATPAVREELFSIMDFWLSYGIDGFRLDAASMLFQRKSLPGTEMPNPEEFLEQVHALVKKHQPDGILLAEADVDEETMPKFVKNGKRMDMLLNFILNAHIFHGLATQKNTMLKKKLDDQVRIPAPSTWVNFLRNLDELNLERLPSDARNEIFKVFASDPDMKALGRGIRRRTAPMLEGDFKRIRMAYSVLFSLPGATMLVYGDEIGMGDNLHLPGRVAVRTPMQWSSSENGGFSEAKTDRLFRQPIKVGKFSFDKVNVADQLNDQDSLLNWIKQFIKLKKEAHEISTTDYQVMDVGDEHLIVLCYRTNDTCLIMINNLSDRTATVELKNLKIANPKVLIASQPKLFEEDKIELQAFDFIWLRGQPL